jgi:hypothetical protein
MLKRAFACWVRGCTRSTYLAASDGAELGPRWRNFASILLDTVIAAVPTAPANRPLPTAEAVLPSPMTRSLAGEPLAAEKEQDDDHDQDDDEHAATDIDACSEGNKRSHAS